MDSSVLAAPIAPYPFLSTNFAASLRSITQRLQRTSLSPNTDLEGTVDDCLLEAFRIQLSVTSSKLMYKKEPRCQKSPRKCHSYTHLKQSENAARNARALERHTLGFQSFSKARAETSRELALCMVYNNITPYPDTTWIDVMAEYTHWYVIT